MRILTVSHFYEAHGGGIERVAAHLSRQFARLGHEAVWSASDADPVTAGEVTAASLSCFDPLERLTGLPMPIPGFRAVRALAKEVRRSDAVVIHDALYLTSILAMVLAKLLGRRAILIQHIAGVAFSSRVLRSIMALANRMVTRPMLWATDELVFISDSVRHELVGTPARRPFHLAFNGIDDVIFHPRSGSARAAWPGAQPERYPRTILFVGRYVEKKGLSVVRALAASRPDLTFLMVGTGPIRPDRWQLDNLHDLGPKSPPELAELYREADLLLLPSVGEGYPLVIQEAMACGLPVVCGAPSHRADPDAAAWLRGVAIDLTDPEGSAARCSQAIDGLALTARDRAAMARHARSKYDWETMARSVLELARPALGTALA